MQKLDGHWVAKRVGILEHYKGMTLAEIVLFDAYLLMANKQTWETWRTTRQLEKLLPMNRHTIIDAKRSLVEKGWIEKINQTGVFIPKLYRYSEDMALDGQNPLFSENMDLVPKTNQKVQNRHQTPFFENSQMVPKMNQMVQNRHQVVQIRHQNGRFEAPIIEEDNIIEDDYILLGSGKNENPGLCKPNFSDPDGRDKDQLLERPLLHLLKFIPGYPFDFEKDLSFIRDLLSDFPDLDMETEIKDWKTWLMDKRFKGKINYRSRLRRWFKNSMKYKEENHERHPIQGRGSNDKRIRSGRKGFDLPSSYPVDAGGIHNENDQGKAEDD